MAFWKKSEDPWDIDPEKKRRQDPVTYFESEEPEEAEESERVSAKELLSGLFRKKEEPAEEAPPVPCPYCGSMMKKGYLKGGRDQVYWSETKPGFLSGLDEAWLISDEGGLLTAAYRTAYMCEPCRKMIVDVPEPSLTNFVWDYGTPEQQGEQEEEQEK